MKNTIADRSTSTDLYA